MCAYVRSSLPHHLNMPWHFKCLSEMYDGLFAPTQHHLRILHNRLVQHNHEPTRTRTATATASPPPQDYILVPCPDALTPVATGSERVCHNPRGILSLLSTSTCAMLSLSYGCTMAQNSTVNVIHKPRWTCTALSRLVPHPPTRLRATSPTKNRLRQENSAQRVRISAHLCLHTNNEDRGRMAHPSHCQRGASR